MGHNVRVYGYVGYNFTVGASTIAGTSLLPGQMNFALKLGSTACIGGATLDAAYGQGYIASPGEIINSDGATKIWIGAPGADVIAYVLTSRSQGFENQ